MTVLAATAWSSNAELIADAAMLGYLHYDWLTLDCTYGLGTFWKVWRPAELIGCDIDAAKSPIGWPVDFTRLPWPDRFFPSVVFDGPYKLNGTPAGDEMDERYGTHTVTKWQDRMQLLKDGMGECARVLGDGFLLVKCQDQVCSGKVRWQSVEMVKHGEGLGLGLVDRFDRLGHREQPKGRRQVHAARNSSQLLVFKRGWKSV